MRRGPGLPQIPNYLPPGGSLPLSCSFGSEAPGGHGNMGPASRVPMTTGSPSGGAGAHQSVQVAPFGRGARREVGGRGGGCRGVASPLPIPSSRGRRSRPPCALRLPESHGPRATTAHHRVTSARRGGPSSLCSQTRPCFQAPPDALPGHPGCPRKYPRSGAASPEMQGSRQAPPLPVLMELSGGAPPGLARCPAVSRLRPQALTATEVSLLVPVGTRPRDCLAALRPWGL